MKLIYTILILFSFTANAATTYHVSNTGSDAANGMTDATAWQHVSKVNSSSFSPGDSILFKAGGTWNEKLIVPSSGSSGLPIVFGSYGSGALPIITGFQTQGSFTNVGNIWTATATNAVKRLNTVLIGGNIQAMARTPNTGYNTFSTYSGNTQITTSLSGTPDYSGGHVVIRSASWILDRTNITTQSGGVLNLSPALTYTPNLGGNGYFLQNNVSDLDVQNEWTYDSATKTMKVYSTSSPSVQISTIDTLIYVKKKNYVTFYNLSVQGANVATIQMDSCRYISILHCNMNYSGDQGIVGRYDQHTIVTNDSIQNTLSNAIYMREYVTDASVNNDICDSTKIDSVYIHNTGFLPGMGQLLGTGENANFQYFGINVNGNDDTLTNIVLDSTGYVALFFTGKRNIIEYNYVKYFDFLKDDGGGIYTAVYNIPNSDTGSIIRHNVVIHGIGAGTGTSNGSQAVDIYLDNTTMGVLVDSNTTIDAQYGVLFNGSVKCLFYDNTSVDSAGPVYNLSTFAGSPSGIKIKRNIFYSQNSTQPVMFFSGTDFTQSVDSNYYLRPTAPSTMMKMSSTTYSLSGWQSATGYDANSSGAPSSLTGALPLIVYNPYHTDSTFTLTGNYKEANGAARTGVYTLHGFSSVILFPATALTYILNNRYNLVK